jgi:hypothetical protein
MAAATAMRRVLIDYARTKRASEDRLRNRRGRHVADRGAARGLRRAEPARAPQLVTPAGIIRSNPSSILSPQRYSLHDRAGSIDKLSMVSHTCTGL